MSEGNLAEIIRHVQEGDPDAFAALYNRTAKQAYYLSYKLVQNEEDAKDVVQESMLELFESIAMVRHPAAFRSYFNRVLYHNSMDLLRKRQKDYMVVDAEETMLTIESDEMKPQDYLERQERQTAILQVIDELSPEQKMVVLMFYYEHMPVKEIAKTLEIQESAVKNRLTRARGVLRQKLNEENRSKNFILGGMLFFPRGLRELLQKDAAEVFSPGIGEEIWMQLEPQLYQAGMIQSGVGLAAQGGAAVAAAGGKISVSQGVKVLIAAATFFTGAWMVGNVVTNMPSAAPDQAALSPTPPGIEETVEPSIEPSIVIDEPRETLSPADQKEEPAAPIAEEIEVLDESEVPLAESDMPAEEPAVGETPPPIVEETVVPEETKPNTSTGGSSVPEIQVHTRWLSYPQFTELTAQQILVDCGAVLSENSGGIIVVNGLAEILMSEPGQYAVFLSVMERSDISSKVITISVEHTEEAE